MPKSISSNFVIDTLKIMILYEHFVAKVTDWNFDIATFNPLKDAFSSSRNQHPRKGLDIMQGNVSAEHQWRFIILDISTIDFRFYVPRKKCTDTFLDDRKSAICGALRERIVLLSKFGINNFWMRAHGSDSSFHIASIVGILIDDWHILVTHSSNIINKDLWGRK